jgi:hypothetical protein
MVEITSHGVVSVETLVVNVANPATVGCRPYQRVEIRVNNVDGSVLTLNLYTQENTNMAFSHTERTQ